MRIQIAFLAAAFAAGALAAPARTHQRTLSAIRPLRFQPQAQRPHHGAVSAASAETLSAAGTVTAWSVFTHPKFPRYSVRVRSEDPALCDPSVKQHVGYLDTDDGKHFFFWFFESRSKPSSDPLVLWLNGGPGCSSLTGLFMELGPCRANPGGNGTTVNRSSWNNNANVIFLDQPANVGFSYTDEGVPKVTDSDAAANDVYAFLQIFLQAFPEYAKLPFHVTGESYAGHYIPAIAKVIVENNAALTTARSILGKNSDLAAAASIDGKANDDDVIINFQSIAIGNGLTDPLVQYKYYPDMACDDKYGPILDEATCDTMRSKYPTCQSLISSCYKWQSPFTCIPSIVYCNSAMIQPFQTTGKNIYDIRKDCDSSNPLCYDILNDIEAYLNDPDIQAILGVDVSYEGCNRQINVDFTMAGDYMRPYVNYIPPLLESGLDILIYAGDADYICNWIGNKAWSVELEWSGQDGFSSAEDNSWTSKITGKPAGEFRMYDNFAFVRVYEAGHMVPYDQPEHSLELINHWLVYTSDKSHRERRQKAVKATENPFVAASSPSRKPAPSSAQLKNKLFPFPI